MWTLGPLNHKEFMTGIVNLSKITIGNVKGHRGGPITILLTVWVNNLQSKYLCSYSEIAVIRYHDH